MRAFVWLAPILLLAACAGSGTAPQVEPSPKPSTSTPGPATTHEEATEQSLLLATEQSSDGLAFVDPSVASGSAVVDRVVVGEAPWGIAVDAASARAYVSTAEGVAVVDLAARRRTALIPYRNQPTRIEHGEYRQGGMGIAVSPDGSRIYVAVHRASGTSVLEVIDAGTARVVDQVEVGLRPFDVLVAQDGAQIYTVDHDSFTVTAVRADTLEARSITVAPFGTDGGLSSWEKPHYAVLDADGALLLPYQGKVLARLDPRTDRVTTSPMSANTHQHGIAVADGGRLLVVGTGSFGNATGTPSLTIRTAAGEEELVPLDRLHETVTTWSHDGREYAVLAGGYTRAGAWDGMTVVDLETHARRRIEVAGKPQVVVPLPALP